MNIRQLTVFTAVCEEMSFTKAANRLYMTQPAVSHAIGELETETGCVLFERISRRICLTEAGKAFWKKADELLALYRDLERFSGTLNTSLPLRIGSSITIANFWLPDIMKRFKKNCPGIPVRVWIDSAAKTEERLMNNEIDIGLIEGVIHYEKLVSRPFSSYGMAVICAPEHPFGTGESVSVKELLEETLILREKGSAARDVFDSALRLQNLYAEPAWTSVNSQAIIEAVKHNMGIGILPEILVKKELSAQTLKVVSVREMILQNSIYIAIHRDKYQTDSMRIFEETVLGKA